MSAGIYIHLPFCIRKCKYCDFLSGSYSSENIIKYHEALVNEIKNTNIDEPYDTIFIGGGTPSIYPTELLKEIIVLFSVKDNMEVTIECNPGTVDLEKLSAYNQMGINRISFGLQSGNNKELKILGRIHTYEEFLESYNNARAAGFKNINIDLMSAIPTQTLESYKETLEKVISLKPEHISSYSLIIEEGTEFFDKYSHGGEYENLLPDEDTEREMYYETKRLLNKAGYKRYEISNYAKREKENYYISRHNEKYWLRENYYGFGLGAASLVNNVRYSNTTDFRKYIEILTKTNETIQLKNYVLSIRDSIEKLSLNSQIEEFVFLGLRRMEGIDLNKFKKEFSKDFFQIYNDIVTRQLSLGLIKYEKNKIYLTKKGIDLSNTVMAEYILN